LSKNPAQRISTETQKLKRPDLVYEKSVLKLVEITCPWPWVDYDSGTLEEAYRQTVDNHSADTDGIWGSSIATLHSTIIPDSSCRYPVGIRRSHIAGNGHKGTDTGTSPDEAYNPTPITICDIIRKSGHLKARYLFPHPFSVNWKIENPATGFIEAAQEKTSPLISVESAWQLLHNDVPRIFEKATFNFHGKLRPGKTIQADIVREQAEITVSFEVYQNGSISFMFERIFNVASWSEIHAYYSEIDKRIPPLACYIREEKRACYANALLEFRLADGIDVPDTPGEDGGVSGGTNAKGQILPLVIVPQQPIYTRGH
jgi:hypothetical protein